LPGRLELPLGADAGRGPAPSAGAPLAVNISGLAPAPSIRPTAACIPAAWLMGEGQPADDRGARAPMVRAGIDLPAARAATQPAAPLRLWLSADVTEVQVQSGQTIAAVAPLLSQLPGRSAGLQWPGQPIVMLPTAQAAAQLQASAAQPVTVITLPNREMDHLTDLIARGAPTAELLSWSRLCGERPPELADLSAQRQAELDLVRARRRLLQAYLYRVLTGDERPGQPDP
jgi:hypothetical protein